MPKTKEIKILGKKITLQRLTLKGWAELENLKQEMDEVEKGDFDKYFQLLVCFIELSISDLLKPEWEKVPWYEVIIAYKEVIILHQPTLNFPILVENKKETKKFPWEYKGRSWYFWLNFFASSYGWEEKTVELLDIDTALGLYQEVLLTDQLDREWWWGLSEIAYPYNKSTKKQEFKPLDRPRWMLPSLPKQLPVVKMRKSMIPVGNVVSK